MALVDDFKSRFPEFPAAVVDQRIPVLVNVWPAYYGGGPYPEDNSNPIEKEIILLLLAHLMSLTAKQAASMGAGTAATGAVQSKSVGGVSVSYAASNDTSINRDFFGTTSYGQMFLQLISANSGAMFV